MYGKAPQTIFTDQDAAMPGAIKSVLPGTYHALCTWHLLQNASRRMGALLCGKCDLMTLMYVVATEEEFNVAWAMMVKKCFPGGKPLHSWLQQAFLIKEQWSSAWLNQHFTAGMHSTQLSESTNAVLRGYLQADYNIVQFFTHFERVVASRRASEKEQDFRAADKLPNNLFPCSPLVKCAGEHYTPTMFAKFQAEYQHILEYMVERVADMDTGDVQAYRCYKIDSDNSQHSDLRIVRVRVENITLACSCRYYDSVGIFCRHILTVMEYLRAGGNTQMRTLPPYYILKRWTMKAKLGVQLPGTVSEAFNPPNGYAHAQQYQELCAMMVGLARSVCTDDNMCRVVKEKFKELCLQVQELSKSCAREDATETDESTASKLYVFL